MSAAKIVLTVCVIVAYVALSHAALVIEDTFSIWRRLAVWMLALPVIGFMCWGVAMAMRVFGSARLLPWISGGVVACFSFLVVVDFQTMLLTRLDWLYLTQHVVSNAMLCWLFLQTLCGGRVPLITTLARSIHPDNMPDSVVNYTRKVTLAWACFFALQVGVSLAIFYFASIQTWSMFANVLNWPLVVLMFAGEYLCRKRCNPDFSHVSIRESVSAYVRSRKKT